MRTVSDQLRSPTHRSWEHYLLLVRFCQQPCLRCHKRWHHLQSCRTDAEYPANVWLKNISLEYCDKKKQLTLSTLSFECPVVWLKILIIAFFCSSTSFHFKCSSIACLWPVEGTRGWWSMAVACGVINLFPLSPADKIMHAWPIATPVPTVYICTEISKTLAKENSHRRGGAHFIPDVLHCIINWGCFSFKTNNLAVCSLTASWIYVYITRPGRVGILHVQELRYN